MSDELETIEGRIRIRFVNDFEHPVDQLSIWLYPNTFAQAVAGVKPANRDFYQPFGPGLGGMRLRQLAVDGSPATASPVPVSHAPAGTAWRLPLAQLLGPGDEVEVSIAFETRIPHRLGPLSEAHGILTALGGWYPYLIAGDPETMATLDRRPRAADWSVRLGLPDGTIALIGGELADSAGWVFLQDREWVDLVVRPEGLRPVMTRHGAFWPMERAPSPGDPDRPIPDPDPLPSSWVGDSIVDLMEKLDRWADLQGVIPASGPIELVMVPMRGELAVATPGIVAISDRAYKVMPIPLLLRFHGKAIARAYFMRRLLPLVRQRETPAMVFQVADALASIFADRFAEQVLDQSKGASGILGAFDFIPSVDDFLRSADSAFAHVYFQPVADPIHVRDEAWTFNDEAPRGKLLREKLQDRFGPFQLPLVFNDYLTPHPGCPPPPRSWSDAGPCSLQSFAEEHSGWILGPFFRAWSERFPEEDLRTRIISVERRKGRGYRSLVEVWRIGDTPPELIEAEARDRLGTRIPLVWIAEAGVSSHIFEIDSAAPVESVRVDPRDRVFQTPAEPGELAALGDRVPPRLQPLLTRLSLSYATSDRAFFGDVFVLFRPRDAVRRRLALGFSYQKARAEVNTSLTFGFGKLVGAARYTHNAGIGLFVDLLRAGFAGSEAPQGYAIGPTLFYTFDDRLDSVSPMRGTAVFAAYSPAIGASKGGESAFFEQASLAAVRLFPLSYSQTLALRLKGSLITGDAPFQKLIPLGGSDAGLRGFSYEEVLGRRLAIASLEWRHPYVVDMDLDLGFARIQGLSGALFADGAAMGGTLRPQAVEPGPSSSLFADFGYGLRLHYALFGVRPQVLGVDIAVPLGRIESVPGLSPVTINIRAGQAFATP